MRVQRAFRGRVGTFTRENEGVTWRMEKAVIQRSRRFSDIGEMWEIVLFLKVLFSLCL